MENEVRSIDPSVASKLFQTIGAKSVFLGVSVEGEIIAAIEFRYPEDFHLKSHYSTEIGSVFCLPMANGLLNSIVDAYIEIYDPADLSLTTDLYTGYFESSDKLALHSIDGIANYEWINPYQTHYTYRITASNSTKYYYGVSHVKQYKAIEDDCLNDGYWGSGAKAKTNKFFNWKRKHRDFLEKEVLAIFTRKSNAYAHEKELVGDRWRTDSQCLNSAPGGKDGWINRNVLSNTIRSCLIHGDTIHRGDKCYRCIAMNSVSLQICPIHGESKFRGETCQSCTNDNIREKICSIHGLTKHKGNSCIKCSVSKAQSMRMCSTHGETLHLGDICARCNSSSAFSQQTCHIHGLSSFQGNQCLNCKALAIDSQMECENHGLVTHRGTKCLSCIQEKRVKLRICPIHGETKHQGNICCSCNAEKGSHSRYHKTELRENCRFCYPTV